jgi:hypothetical protein
LGAAQLALAINAKGVDELFATAGKWRKISNIPRLLQNPKVIVGYDAKVV